MTGLVSGASDEELLHMLGEAPDDWSDEALEAARNELRARGVAWEEKAKEAPSSISLAAKVAYLVIGVGGGAFMLVLGLVFHVNPRWLILVAVALGGLGTAVPRRPKRDGS